MFSAEIYLTDFKIFKSTVQIFNNYRLPSNNKTIRKYLNGLENNFDGQNCSINFQLFLKISLQLKAEVNVQGCN
jgi:hypothetical protein